ncbi:MAG: molybdopterin-dependent oxidoreductase [Gammaproteobacteria bacterium]|nr:molybdopterin-dependent oxidoreductase [Gammaproteobacteria bacterium]
MPAVVKSTCPYCGVGCGLCIESQAHGEWLIRGDEEHPANFGRLCSKGTALNETLGFEGRLTSPMIDGQETGWDEALDLIADGFRRVIDEHGPNAVAFYVSGQLLTEDYYVANKLMKGFIGSGNIDTNSRLCMSSSVAGHKRAFGSDTVPGCYEDFEQADLIVLTGSNIAWCHPVLYRRIARAKEARPEMRVVVIDPRETATCDLADLHLPLKAGSDSVLFSGLLGWLHDNDCIDDHFVRNHTEGAEAALQAAHWYAPSITAVAEHCGLDPHKVRMFYRWFAAAARTVTLYSQGINQTSSGTDKVNAIINCHLFTGRIGKPGAGPFSITGQPNAMGGREVGALSNQLACHMELENARHRELVGRFWQSPNLAQEAGLKAVDMFHAVERKEIKALWIMATNPVVTLPDANQVQHALDKCELLVVSENMRWTDTTAYAHVLLPAQTWGEKDGTVTNSERRISRQQRFLTPLGQSKPDWWIICQVAMRLGYPGFEYASSHEIFSEYASLSGYENGGERDFDISGLSGLSAADYERLQSVQWPVRSGALQGTRRLFTDGRFYTPDRKAKFQAVVPRPPGHMLNPDYPLVLNTGRVRDQWHTMSRTGKSPRLAGRDPEPFVEINPQDARQFAVEEGELVRVSSHWGEVILRARITERQQAGTVFAPMHWNGQFASNARVGTLVNPVTDPLSGQPEFKHTPVAMTPYRPAWQGFLLTRQAAVILQPASLWTRTRREGLWHYELAGEELADDWSDLARKLSGSDQPVSEWAEMQDRAGGRYRGVSIIDGSLAACLFIGPDHKLPARDWLVQLFSKSTLASHERMRLLAGTPAANQQDAGRTICACFNVGENTLIKGICDKGLVTLEAIGKTLQAGTNCGSCLSEINTLIQRYTRSGAATPYNS